MRQEGSLEPRAPESHRDGSLHEPALPSICITITGRKHGAPGVGTGDMWRSVAAHSPLLRAPQAAAPPTDGFLPSPGHLLLGLHSCRAQQFLTVSALLLGGQVFGQGSPWASLGCCPPRVLPALPRVDSSCLQVWGRVLWPRGSFWGWKSDSLGHVQVHQERPLPGVAHCGVPVIRTTPGRRRGPAGAFG